MYKKQPLISVIIPVYNVEEYLERCVQSVLNQTYKNLEIILVDDESKDSSGILCDKLALQDTRIKVVHKKNQGLGMARNTGMKYAMGDYISFIDSDDYINSSTYEELLKALKEYDDAIYFGHIRVIDSNELPVGTIPKQLSYSGEDVLNEFFLNSLGELPRGNGNDFTGISACCALYNKRFLYKNNIVFKSERDILSEDIIFNLEVCSKAKNIRIFPNRFYYYILRTTSLTKSYRIDRFKASKFMQKYLINELEKSGVSNLRDYRILLYFLVNLIVCIKQEVCCVKELSFKKSIHNINEICKDDFVQDVLDEFSLNKLPLSLKIWFLCLKNRFTYLLFFMTKIQLLRS
ncbi:TPA: glycosyltransferase family 2 protein [Clostridium perfringens]